jgi:hypothetical protein
MGSEFPQLMLPNADRAVARRGQPSAFGQTFEVSGILIGPTGRSGEFTTIWLVRTGDDVPRLVTAFPR